MSFNYEDLSEFMGYGLDSLLRDGAHGDEHRPNHPSKYPREHHPRDLMTSRFNWAQEPRVGLHASVEA